MRCSKCGTRNAKKYKFCKECGEELVGRPAAAPPPQPAVVIVQQDRRRGVPALIWILVGMILIVLLCGLLVWLDFVDVPGQIRVVLPEPIGDLVDAIDDARPPGAPNLPGGVAQDQPDQQWQPSQPQQADQASDVCDEDLSRKLIVLGHQFDAPIPFSREAIGRFRAIKPFDALSYDLYIDQHGETNGPFRCGTRTVGDEYEIYTQESIQFDNGFVIFRFTPVGRGCVLEEIKLVLACASGEIYRDGWTYNNGCCTHGCWCNHPSTGQPGCWQECAPQCVE